MSTFKANRERTVRSIETRLRGLSITAEQADRLLTAIGTSAATAAWDPEGGRLALTPEEAAVARSWYTRLPIGVTPEDVALARALDDPRKAD